MRQPPFEKKCDHEHDLRCSSCEELKTILNEIKDAVAESKGELPSADHWDDLTFRTSQAITAIFAWKAHEVRFVQQDKPRHSIIDQLAPNEVMITEDWAMKFLPQKYRETQSDWFGKRGISWHISVAMHKTSTGELQQQAFVHILKNCNQEADSVIAVMEHTLRTIKAENQDISTAYYRHDNAGCYHSTSVLVACHFMKEATGIEVTFIT